MLDPIKSFLGPQQAPADQPGTSLLLLSAIIDVAASYTTLEFINAFETIVSGVYFDWGNVPSGRYTKKFDQSNKLILNFRGNNSHSLAGLKQTT